MIPVGPMGPVDRRRTTVLSKMWTPSSFSVAMSRQPFSGSWIRWAHLSPMDNFGGSMLHEDEEGLSRLDIFSSATSLALKDLQSLVIIGLMSSSFDDDEPNWQHFMDDEIPGL